MSRKKGKESLLSPVRTVPLKRTHTHTWQLIVVISCPNNKCLSLAHTQLFINISSAQLSCNIFECFFFSRTSCFFAGVCFHLNNNFWGTACSICTVVVAFRKKCLPAVVQYYFIANMWHRSFPSESSRREKSAIKTSRSVASNQRSTREISFRSTWPAVCTLAGEKFHVILEWFWRFFLLLFIVNNVKECN